MLDPIGQAKERSEFSGIFLCEVHKYQKELTVKNQSVAMQKFQTKLAYRPTIYSIKHAIIRFNEEQLDLHYFNDSMLITMLTRS